MKVIYRYYEPNQGLEEVQAKIFNFNMNKLKTFDQRGDPKEIQKRYEIEKIDPKLIRYVFTEDMKPLAYIQSRINQNKTISIGYPWTMPECPIDIQEQLFDELMEYIKEKKKPKEINYWLYYRWKEQINFFKKKGFQKNIEGYHYDFSILETSKLEVNKNFNGRLATLEDLDLLLEVSLLDKDMQKAGLTKKWLEGYFKEKVLPDGHCILIFKDDQIVCASAPLKQMEEEKEIIILRFTAMRPDNEEAWPQLISHISKECIRSGWINNILRINTRSDSKISSILKKLNPIINSSYDFYVLEL